MKEIFEDVFDNFMENMEEFKMAVNRFAYSIMYFLIIVTVPFWAIPYMIIKKIRERKHDGET